MTLRDAWTNLLDDQHRYPTGLVGRLIGERMVRQHAPETLWTINQLALLPTDHVVEIGFGAGRGLALAAQQTPQGYVLGLDLSPTMICAASRRNAALLQAGRLELLRGNIDAVPLRSAHVDKIFSIHTFYFWADPAATIHELVALLKHGGRLAITLATGKTSPGGQFSAWPLHQKVEALVQELHQQAGLVADLQYGPDSRQYNNVAIMVDKL